MTVTRRELFLAGATVAAGSAFLPAAFAEEEAKSKPEAKLKLSSQLGIIPGNDLAAKLAQMEQWGFDGVELRGDIVGNEKKYEDALKKTKLKVSAICWGSCKGDLVSDAVEKRPGAVEALKRVVASAGALGSTGVIYVPAFNRQTNLGNQEIRKILLDTLPAVGEHALKAGTRVLLEPLNRREAFFLRQVADGASIARDCNSNGVGVMGDFYHMFFEETSNMGAFISGGSRLHHVHMASGPSRKLPGQDAQDAAQYIDGFRGLKWVGFQDYCSFECGVKGDANVEIPKSLAFLRDQWAKAV